ncbi:zinc ribbon domain-containing protein [Undibacterium flavidum]|uniref:Zinc ribbon domain-containing protein n=1 Tax=Undibacterium flavidum TaxID=2762297 RepID=A0ABR6YAZ4_9BURK|nr:zinc ribbon domain-containing protein [Undibacterium flavidum]MBC3873382.1 zinc ribbon domain-containing protein [Undibacterium flavidum]
MNIVLFPFMVLAAIGFILSLAAHLASLTGIQVPGGEAVWSLHMGIFVVWIPTVLISSRLTKNTNQRDFWKATLGGCPLWMRRALYGIFAYAIVNFLYFMFVASRHEAAGSEIRGFSGHWMVFYGAAFATMYSVRRAPHLLRDRKCSNGHAVPPSAQFCQECGIKLLSPNADA